MSRDPLCQDIDNVSDLTLTMSSQKAFYSVVETRDNVEKESFLLGRRDSSYLAIRKPNRKVFYLAVSKPPIQPQ